MVRQSLRVSKQEATPTVPADEKVSHSGSEQDQLLLMCVVAAVSRIEALLMILTGRPRAPLLVMHRHWKKKILERINFRFAIL